MPCDLTLTLVIVCPVLRSVRDVDKKFYCVGCTEGFFPFCCHKSLSVPSTAPFLTALSSDSNASLKTNFRAFAFGRTAHLDKIRISGCSRDHLREVQSCSCLKDRGTLDRFCFAFEHDWKRRDTSTAYVSEHVVSCHKWNVPDHYICFYSQPLPRMQNPRSWEFLELWLSQLRHTVSARACQLSV